MNRHTSSADPGSSRPWAKASTRSSNDGAQPPAFLPLHLAGLAYTSKPASLVKPPADFTNTLGFLLEGLGVSGGSAGA